MSVAEIIEACGGKHAISDALGGVVSPEAVRRWLYRGIPQRHYDLVARLSTVSVDTIHAATMQVKTHGRYVDNQFSDR